MANRENAGDENESMPTVDAVEAETSIFDADGALTRDFLLERGFCCENGCKNCPYGFRRETAEDQQGKAARAHEKTSTCYDTP